jgi:hypothetical protein
MQRVDWATATFVKQKLRPCKEEYWIRTAGAEPRRLTRRLAAVRIQFFERSRSAVGIHPERAIRTAGPDHDRLTRRRVAVRIPFLDRAGLQRASILTLWVLNPAAEPPATASSGHTIRSRRPWIRVSRSELPPIRLGLLGHDPWFSTPIRPRHRESPRHPPGMVLTRLAQTTAQPGDYEVSKVTFHTLPS